MRLIDEYRKANKLPLIEPVSSHIESAAIMGLGNSKESEIDTVRVGLESLR